jgi:hypothetical protein
VQRQPKVRGRRCCRIPAKELQFEGPSAKDDKVGGGVGGGGGGSYGGVAAEAVGGVGGRVVSEVKEKRREHAQINSSGGS